MQLAGFSCAAVITPSDTVDLDPGFTPKALYIGVSGDLTLITSRGHTVLVKAAPVGVLHLQVDRVKATGTTATTMLVLGD